MFSIVTWILTPFFLLPRQFFFTIYSHVKFSNMLYFSYLPATSQENSCACQQDKVDNMACRIIYIFLLHKVERKKKYFVHSETIYCSACNQSKNTQQNHSHNRQIKLILQSGQKCRSTENTKLCLVVVHKKSDALNN